MADALDEFLYGGDKEQAGAEPDALDKFLYSDEPISKPKESLASDVGKSFKRAGLSLLSGAGNAAEWAGLVDSNPVKAFVAKKEAEWAPPEEYMRDLSEAPAMILDKRWWAINAPGVAITALPFMVPAAGGAAGAYKLYRAGKLGQMGLQTAMAAGATGASSVSNALFEGSLAYGVARERGADHELASDVAAKTAGKNFAWTAVTSGVGLFNPLIKGVITKLAVSSIMEGVQEVGEERISGKELQQAGLGADPGYSLSAGVLGMVGGAGMDVAMGGLRPEQNATEKQAKAEIVQNVTQELIANKVPEDIAPILASREVDKVFEEGRAEGQIPTEAELGPQMTNPYPAEEPQIKAEPTPEEIQSQTEKELETPYPGTEKKPYETTVDEFVDLAKKETEGEMPMAQAIEAHRSVIEAAEEAGKEVPAEALSEAEEDQEEVGEELPIGTVEEFTKSFPDAEPEIYGKMSKAREEAAPKTEAKTEEQLTLFQGKQDSARAKKIKDFVTDEGQFSVYDVEPEPKGFKSKGRADMFTVLKNKEGFIIRNAFVPKDLARKGIATEFYIRMNKESINETGNPLRSTQPRKLITGEIVHELSDDAIKLWDSFVAKGYAEKIGYKNYIFKKEKLQNDSQSSLKETIAKQLTEAKFEPKEVEYYSQVAAAGFTGIAKRAGLDPVEVYQKYGLKIRREGEKVEPSGKTLEQSQKIAPAFYHKLQNDIESKLQEKSSPEQVLAIIRENKEEERKWSGIDDYIKGKEKINKSELLDFLRGNQLEIKEVEKGARGSVEDFNRRYNKFVEGLKANQVKGGALTFRNPYDLRDEGKLTKKEIEQLAEFDAESKADMAKNSKFSEYQLPGGENYRELLLTLPDNSEAQRLRDEANNRGYGDKISEWPDKEFAQRYREKVTNVPELSTFESTHFDEPNILAHIRFNDRVDFDGNKVLFLEEVQSDWHQKGRRTGYAGDNKPLSIEEKREYERLTEDGRKDRTTEQNARVEELGQRLTRQQRGEVPDAPFKKTWHEFALKRMIRFASENGYDKIGWTTGEQQADRYDLSKQVDFLTVTRIGDGNVIVKGQLRGTVERLNKTTTENNLSDVIGKDIASSALKQEVGKPKTYQGPDLKVGGEGMKGFYDKIIPSFLNKLGKKYGASVGETNIPKAGEKISHGSIGSDGNKFWVWGNKASGRGDEKVSPIFDSFIKADNWRMAQARGVISVNSMTITPKLKEVALQEGFSLFQKDKTGARGRITFTPEGVNLDLLKTADKSTFLHEMSHFFLEVMGDLSEASPDLKTDYSKILKWLGVESREGIKREHHEKFAKASERYFADGKAPTEELKSAFEQFKTWLTEVYGELKKLGVKFSKEVTEVMDGLYAASEEWKAEAMGERAPPTTGQEFEQEAPIRPYRSRYPNVRGGWTIEKIQRELKKHSSDLSPKGFKWNREVSKFDSPKELSENIYFHGTGGYVSGGLKSGGSLPSSYFRSGGYGEKYNTISLSKSKNVASNFTGSANSGTVYPVILRKGANVISMPEISDSSELEDILPRLWDEGVDAVKIGDWTKASSEQELSVLNPRAVIIGIGESYQVFQKKKFEQLSDKEISDIHEKAKKYVSENPRALSYSQEPLEPRIPINPQAFADIVKRRRIKAGSNITVKTGFTDPGIGHLSRGRKGKVLGLDIPGGRVLAEFNGEPIIVNPLNLQETFVTPEVEKKLPTKKQIAKSTGMEKDPEAELLKIKFSSMEKGSKIAARFAAREERGRLLTIFRDKTQNEALAKAAIVKYVRANVPAEMRGKFLTIVENAKNMTHVFNAFLSADQVASDAYRKGLISDIRKLVNRALGAGNVSVEFKSKINAIMEGIEMKGHRPETLERLRATKDYIEREQAKAKAEGRDIDPKIEMPAGVLAEIEILSRKALADVSEVELEKLVDTLEMLEQQGKAAFRSVQHLYAMQKEKTAKDLIAGTSPIEKHEKIARRPGEMLSTRAKLKNVIADVMDRFQNIRLAITPADVFFDLMGKEQGFVGAPFRLIKKVLDADYGAYLDKVDSWVKPVRDLRVSLKMNDLNGERIGIHATKVQRGGMDKLLQLGLTEDYINSIKLTDDEMKAYKFMREQIEKPYPHTKKLIAELYNMDLGKVDNYFPFQSDPEAMTDLDVTQRFGEMSGFSRLSKTEEKGSTIKRVGGKQKIRINAFDAFEIHMMDSAYLVSTQKNVKMLFEIVNSPAFREAAGEVGQRIALQWLDVVAKNGGASDAGKPLVTLDLWRRNIGAATMGFKLSSILVQTTSLFDAAAMIGGNYVRIGIQKTMFDSEYRKFLLTNMPELRDRVVDSPDFAEMAPSKMMAKYQRKGFAALQWMDSLVATATAGGAYQKWLDQNGKTWTGKAEKEGIEYATLAMRRTQSSPMFKDASLALSRGALTGNRSIDKMLLQYQSFMLNRWSFIEHDVIRLGWKGGNKADAAWSLAYLTMAQFAEMGIRSGSKAAIIALAGGSAAAVKAALDGDDDEYKITKQLLGNVPFVGNFIQSAIYGSNPVPTIQTIEGVFEGAGQVMKAKQNKTALRGTAKAIGSIARLSGIPGTAQAQEIARTLMADNKLKFPFQKEHSRLKELQKSGTIRDHELKRLHELTGARARYEAHNTRFKLAMDREDMPGAEKAAESMAEDMEKYAD